MARRNSSNLLLRKEKPPVIGRLIFLPLFEINNSYTMAKLVYFFLKTQTIDLINNCMRFFFAVNQTFLIIFVIKEISVCPDLR